ncbi:hypothetical protein PoB_002457700 [Plakobranchus ocellatus]|uniref:Uncharacterized protein n=1 Tax=Plakobranchus ocellatus TaxID=259542 RepID=A0AAV3ZSE9_9GAST|nr:hypothetical protein PoB_002457700 [Plakobranchus ocellatus]
MKLDSDPTEEYNKCISDKLELGVSSCEIDFDTAKRPSVTLTITDNFITSSRSTKNIIQEGNECPTEIISLFADYHFKDLVKVIISYVGDDMDYLRKIILWILEDLEDIHRFCRHLHPGDFFPTEENTTPHEPLPSFLQKLSSFTPHADKDPALDAFIKVVIADLMTFQPIKSSNNIPTEEK